MSHSPFLVGEIIHSTVSIVYSHHTSDERECMSNAKQFFRYQIFEYCQLWIIQIPSKRFDFIYTHLRQRNRSRSAYTATHVTLQPLNTQHIVLLHNSNIKIQKYSLSLFCICYYAIISLQTHLNWNGLHLHGVDEAHERESEYGSVNGTCFELWAEFEWIIQKQNQMWYAMRQSKSNRAHPHAVYILHARTKFPRAFIEHKIIKIFLIHTQKIKQVELAKLSFNIIENFCSFFQFLSGRHFVAIRNTNSPKDGLYQTAMNSSIELALKAIY